MKRYIKRLCGITEGNGAGARRWVRTLLLLGPALVLVAACGEDSQIPVVSQDLVRMDADNVVYGMTQVLTREGLREGVVEADTAYFFQDSSAVHLRGVNMLLYNPDGSERARVTSEEGRLDAVSEDMIARRDVMLRISGRERTIETEVLNYSAADDLIWSDTTTTMEEDGQVTCGSAFRSDLDFQDVRITRARTTGCP